MTPHFDLPFRFAGTSAAVVEQDSHEDIGNCVEAIIRTPLGYRNDDIDFGFPQLEFHVDVARDVNSDVIQLVRAQEPRADILMTERPDLIDPLMDIITVEIR